MIVLVINAGSSSVKFTCFNMAEDQAVLINGLIERIGLEGTRLKYSNYKGKVYQGEAPVSGLRQAVELIASLLIEPDSGVLKSLDEVQAIGHRVGHGGEKISDPTVIDETVKGIIRECFDICPLHNPHHLAGIEACEVVFPGVPNVGVFDTAFHSTMPPSAFLYGLPFEYYQDHKIRRYGFHGTSHGYVARQAADLMATAVSDLKIITCHLGNGASIAAVDGGKSRDTSMGFTPLEGLIMGTRCGDLDPAIVPKVMSLKHLDPTAVDALLNKNSGLMGLAGIGSSDLRDIEDEYRKGNEQCGVALETYAYRIKKYIGAYMAALGDLDALVFTAGVGENSSTVRRMVISGLERWGLVMDQAKNAETSSAPRFINADGSPVKILVIPTDEEREIAIQTMALAS